MIIYALEGKSIENFDSPVNSYQLNLILRNLLDDMYVFGLTYISRHLHRSVAKN
jgi:hypothetical protein